MSDCAQTVLRTVKRRLRLEYPPQSPGFQRDLSHYEALRHLDELGDTLYADSDLIIDWVRAVIGSLQDVGAIT